jgi:signal transduction histidine kinase
MPEQLVTKIDKIMRRLIWSRKEEGLEGICMSGEVTAKLHNKLEMVNTRILENIIQGVLFIDLQGLVLLLNRAGEKLLNMERKKWIGEPFWAHFPDDYLGFSMREALRFGISQKLLYKTVEERDLEIRTIFLFDETPGLLVFLRDLSESTRLQRVANQNDRLRELGAVSLSVVHEIRNPLGGIRGYASLLARDLSHERHLQEMAETILDGTKRLESLVTAILLYARPIQLQMQSVELCAFLKQLGKFVRVDPAYPIKTRLEIHIPEHPLLVAMDPAAIKSSLLNLIYNAIEAMPQGGALTLSLLKLDHSCQIDVSDTGMGIDPKNLGELFLPFFTTKPTGTGLGLIEARKVIEAHGGELTVRSHLGRGTTFTVTLPLRRGSI